MKKVFVFLLSVSFIVACSDSEPGVGGSTEIAFDRAGLLKSLVNNHFISDFEDFAAETETVKNLTNTFTATPTQENLVTLRAAWVKAYKVFQTVAPYDFGKASDISFYFNLNAHPLNVDETKTNILKPAFVAKDLQISTNQDAQGLPAMDYLINGLATSDEDIVAFYTGADAEDYKEYLTAVATRMDTLTDEVLANFKSEAFNSEFTSNTSAAKTGAVNVFVDRFIVYFERRLRSSKIGIPAGEMDRDKRPNQIEAVFMPEISRELALDALENTREIYEGVTTDEVSLSSILVLRGRQDLDTRIKNEFTASREAILNLNENLQLQATTDAAKMLQVRSVLQKLVVSLKNDLISELALEVITADNDSD
ncbi:imelysin family protein [Aquimarina agarivorans]|uniref:imelysin family protein n=1 Tax=Aquimarina agarivorans TaxID=980584 RepID=UPI000248FDC7|nr:imelysin family protein [Aquimarina agarivorans]